MQRLTRIGRTFVAFGAPPAIVERRQTRQILHPTVPVRSYRLEGLNLPTFRSHLETVAQITSVTTTLGIPNDYWASLCDALIGLLPVNTQIIGAQIGTYTADVNYLSLRVLGTSTDPTIRMFTLKPQPPYRHSTIMSIDINVSDMIPIDRIDEESSLKAFMEAWSMFISRLDKIGCGPSILLNFGQRTSTEVLATLIEFHMPLNLPRRHYTRLCMDWDEPFIPLTHEAILSKGAYSFNTLYPDISQSLTDRERITYWLEDWKGNVRKAEHVLLMAHYREVGFPTPQDDLLVDEIDFMFQG